MTIKDANTAAEIAALSPHAWRLIGMALPTGTVTRPADMKDAHWKEATRYMKNHGLATLNPVTMELVLMGTLADKLLGKKDVKPRSVKDETPHWESIIRGRGGDPEAVYKLIPRDHDTPVADFYRAQLAGAFEPKPDESVIKRDWPEAYKEFMKYVAAVGLIWGKMGKYDKMDNILAMPLKGQLSFDNMGMKHIRTASEEQLVEVLTSMENRKNLTKDYSSVGLTLNNWIGRRR